MSRNLWVGGLAIASGLGALMYGRPVSACGASAGSGGVAVCTVDDIREKARKKWRVGATYSWASTKMVFSGDSLADGKQTWNQQRHAAVAVAEWRPTSRFNLQLGAGSLVGGTIDGLGVGADGGDRAVFDPGVVAMVGASYVALRNDGAVPFVLLTGQFAGVFAQTDGSVPYSAFDLRLGTAVGWTLWRAVTPYAVARVFGGPANWEVGGQKVTGTDRYHYQLGGGLSTLIAYRLDLFVEGSALGERGLSAGLGYAF